MVHFWQQVVYEHAFAVSNTFQINASQLTKQFIIHDSVPSGLKSILNVLKQRGKLATKESILDGSFYKPKEESQSMMGWLASGLYRSTIGSLMK
jgi:hypothetical protein